MLRFILKQNLDYNDNNFDYWEVKLLGDPSKTICEFVGGDNDHYMDKDVIGLVAGDYVEFLNEKYFDKGMNQEWPPRTKLQQLEYHQRRVEELTEEIGLEISLQEMEMG